MRSINLIATLGVLCLGSAAWGADPLDAWTAAPSGTQNPLYGVAYGGGQFVATGAGGTILTSPDGIAWTRQQSGTTNFVGRLAFGNGVFAAISAASPEPYQARILTSHDGVKWTSHDPGASSGLYAVTYADSQFVATGGGTGPAMILTSPDGATWTTRLSLDGNTDTSGFTAIAYGNGRWVALGPGTPGVTATSTDGANWSVFPGACPYGSSKIAFGNSVFVAVGGITTNDRGVPVDHALIYSSPDGLSWTKRVDVVWGGPNKLTAITYGGGQFVAAGAGTSPLGGTPGMYTSADGINWVGRNGAGYYGTFGVGYGNGQFLTVGAGGAITRSGVIGKLGASLSSGQLLGTITGVTGQSFAIEDSPDLAAWSVLTNVVISNGVAQFNDPGTVAAGRRFYKAMLVNQ